MLSRSGDACQLKISVRDTGIGIPGEQLKAIFEPFAQADGSVTRKFGGTGLGLSICVKLTELLGARVEVASEVGSGSTFALLIPFALQSQQSAIDLPAALRPRKTLIVDDNQANAEILSRQLAVWGISADVALSGAVALDLLRHAKVAGSPYELALIDGHMPAMNGFDLAIAVRSDRAFAATEVVLLLSSENLYAAAARCQRIGVSRYLLKPVSSNDLKALFTSTALAAPFPLQRKTATAAKTASGLRILLAEDNLINQKVARAMLAKRGHSVSVASNGREAVELCETQKFDLVLMDVQMPEMDGLQATAILRSHARSDLRRLPIIAMTAHAMQEAVDSCRAAGMDAHLTKPIDAARLHALIEEIVLPKSVA